MKKQKGISSLIGIIIIIVVAGLITGGLYYYFQEEIPEMSKIIEKPTKKLVKKIAKPEEIAPSSKEKLAEEEITPKEKVRENELENLSLSVVYLSSDTLKQGDTLLIKVKEEAGMKINKISGEFDAKKIDFFKSATGDWLAIVGISPKKELGKYNLKINFSDNEFKKEINVIKRNFLITELSVTEELKEKGYTPSKIAENIANKDNPSIYEILQIYTQTAYFEQPFIYPLKKIKITGGYGDIRKSGEIALQHLGVDLRAPVGTPVYVVNDGIVCFSEELINYGKTIIVDHGFGIYSLYLHLDNFKVLNNEQVKQGDIVGLSGNSGYSLGPHLHFSVKVNGSSVDPLKFIETIEKKW